MSKNLSAAASTEFDDMVKHAFQTMGSGIVAAVTQRNNVVGDTYKFRAMGKGLANQKASQADVTPMDISHSLITATLGNWNAPEYTDIFDAAEVNFDEKQELAQTIAGALYRRQEQIIIDAMDNATPGATVATSIGGADTNMNIEKVVEASKELNDAGVPIDQDRHIMVSADGLKAMLLETQVGSADYNSVQSLMTGTLDYWMGFHWHIIESRDEGGLTLASGDVRQGYAWHKSAVGLATGIEIKTDVNWIAQKTSWLCNGMMKCGAAIRDTAGLIRVNADET
jgi:hypothetical protein